MVEQICGLRCDYLRSPLDIACLEPKYATIKALLSHLGPETSKLAIHGCGVDGMITRHLAAKAGSCATVLTAT